MYCWINFVVLIIHQKGSDGLLELVTSTKSNLVIQRVVSECDSPRNPTIITSHVIVYDRQRNGHSPRDQSLIREPIPEDYNRLSGAQIGISGMLFVTNESNYPFTTECNRIA